MTQASLQSYEDLIQSGKLKKGQKEIIKLIAQNPGFTIPEMEQALGKRRNEFSGRLSELAAQGIIYVNGKKGNYSKYYYEPSPWARFQIRDKCENESFVKALKKIVQFRSKLPDTVFQRLKSQLEEELTKVNKEAA